MLKRFNASYFRLSNIRSSSFTQQFWQPYTSAANMTMGKRLEALRSQFDSNGIGMYVVLTQDEHDSEYTSFSDNRREFISGEWTLFLLLQY